MGQGHFQQTSLPLEEIVSYILHSGPPSKIVVLTGAGVSTASGIPDFRSPTTGLYANLARLNLPYPEAVFTLDYFRSNPLPFYTLAKELYPGKYYPTISHAFIALLHEKGLLEMLFTQNIDCLDRMAGVPDHKIVEAHGSFKGQRCIECQKEFPEKLMLEAVESSTPVRCLDENCGGLVKPDIVFFGEGLPEVFFQKKDLVEKADLLIVMGTSLEVAPFSMLPELVRSTVPRVLFNRERVGSFGSCEYDCVVLGDCDNGVRKLAEGLGWTEELEELFLKVGGKIAAGEAARLKETRSKVTNDEILEAQINKISADVDSALKISQSHTEKVKAELEKYAANDKSTPSSSSTTPRPSSGPPPAYSAHENVPVATEDIPEKATVVKLVLTEEEAPAPAERVSFEAPASAPNINQTAILDITLPHNKPNSSSNDKLANPLI
ncbi:DHS-like NAD/FAD-binding domain-containing protein [Calycina marina]|uniref:DHS-like NAD/FAD-binding domain-containing protein n=1 Tax=Calycina marina TaxID=1763456 RepID=A0A9P7Z1E8_9HELO|nr:DHS-like NAD/FAD-binding domain-containing protein [Calycina marina]